ncbi:hypothetical protein [Litorisediminicola beolgyonensis]|uniref:Uncharacterized protein n=1 Tax=Litorisediminicola beolgyonensis TaxID=1173614 RepID=A0ABW3ZHV0_9RHOB
MRVLTITATALLLATAATAQDTPGIDDGTSLGELTKSSIANGFDQGAHASDPSGDGRGKGDGDNPRSGLANVVERGTLAATIDLIDGDD